MDFDLLPDLVLYQVFSFFNSVEKIPLKSVCIRWLVLLQSGESDRTLVVFDPAARCNRMVQSLVSLDSSDVSEVTFNRKTATFLIGHRRLEHKRLDRIKKLYVFGLRPVTRFFCELAHMKRLEILKIENCSHAHRDKKHLEIELPNLCSLSVKNCFLSYVFTPKPHSNYTFQSSFVLNFICRIRAPNLVYCSLPEFEERPRIELECFESIRHIKCDYFDANVARKVPNLETLVCKRLQLPFQLQELPRLRKVAMFPYLRPPSHKDEAYDSYYNFEKAYQSLREQRASLARSDLQIVVNGFEDGCESIGELLDLNGQFWDRTYKVDEFHICFTKKNAERIAKNYHKLVRPLPFSTKVNYTNLVRVFNAAIPANFFKKFPEIVSVSVSDRVDHPPDLLAFLENCNNLRCLKLKKCSYDQQFYLHLIRFQSLSHLFVEEPLSGQIDFSFVLQFKNLNYFELRSDRMPLDVAYEFLKSPKSPRAFNFKKLNSKIEIFIESRVTIRYNWLRITREDGTKQWYHQLIRYAYQSHYEREERTMDNFFAFLKKHEYRTFFV